MTNHMFDAIRKAATEPRALFVETTDGRRWTYGDMLADAGRLAGRLIERGVRPGDRVAAQTEKSVEALMLYLACLRAGAVYLPLNPAYTLSELDYFVGDAEPRLLVVAPEKAAGANAVADRHGARLDTLDVHGGGSLLDGLDGSASDFRDVARGADDLAAILYTSGTTGRSKGAMLTHGNLLWSARHAESGELTAWGEEDLSLVPLPLFHSGGTCWAMYAIYVGGGIYITREAGPDHVLAALASAPITKAGLVPALIQMVLNDPKFDRSNIGSLQTIGYGGSPITVDLLRRGIQELGCGFIQMFGMTETSTMGTTLLPEDHDFNRPHLLTSCGKPLHDMSIRIVDGDGRELPNGQTGEILLRCGSVMKGYYGKPEATAEVLVDGWYHSGDAGYLDEEGYLYVRDRIKDMIISGGENIYPAEVETALASHPAVLEVGVIGVPSVKWGEDVKAFVVLRKGHHAGAEELIAFTKTRIASFKAPKSIEFIDALPRNASGKILKREMRAPYWDRAADARQVAGT